MQNVNFDPSRLQGSRSQNVNAIEILRDDHKRLKGLFRQLTAAELRAPEMRSGVIRQVFMELEIHSRIEKEFFYPAVSNLGQATLSSLIDQSQRDHEEVDRVIAELRPMNFHSPELRFKLNELVHRVEEHLQTEEEEIFGPAQIGLEARLRDLGQQMIQRREEMLRDPRFQDALPVATQDPHGGEQMRKRGTG